MKKGHSEEKPSEREQVGDMPAGMADTGEKVGEMPQAQMAAGEKLGSMPAARMPAQEGTQLGDMPSGSADFTPGQPARVSSAESGSQEWRTTSQPLEAYISGNTFEHKLVRFSAIKGVAIFEGDIALGTVDELLRAKSSDLPQRAVVISGNQYRWPNGIVPYDVDPNLPNQQRITDAIKHWEERTSIRFVRRTSGNASQYPDYVYFEDQGGCWSYVGKRGGRQTISLSSGCSTGNTIHEIGHAVTLWHEQSREDRDTFVRIRWENIDPAQRHNFDQHITDGDDIGPYDYCSIMHYPRTAFSINDQPTIEALRPGAECMGQRNGLSDGDIAAILQLYPRRGWASRGGVITSNIAVARNADGRLEVFVRGTDGAVWHTWQTSPNNGWVNGWATRGGRITSNIAVARNADGRLEVFVRGTDGAVWHTWQTSPNNGWVNGWATRGGRIFGDPAVGQNADGRLEVFVRGTDDAVWHTWQTSPNNGWTSGWASRGGVITSNIAVARNADGRLELFVRGTDDGVWHTWQTSPNNGWVNGWATRGGRILEQPVVGQNADGRLELFVRGTNNAVYHVWQTAPNNGWSF